jgi:hypothetical protein
MGLDKFYTTPEVAESFSKKVDEICDFSSFDQIVEPSAGSGNFLSYLPDRTIALDLAPEGENIIQQDFFEYESEYHPLYNPIRVLTIGNPPFGSGYMNPLAKGFFNKAATFSEVIAFIIPQKFMSSWKVQYQLDKSFGLYYSEEVPKFSFTSDGKPYDVNCCAQIWSSVPITGLTDIRIRTRPPTTHEDFELFLTCDNVQKRAQVRTQIKNGQYWDFALKYWGKIGVCEMDSVDPETTTHYVFKTSKPYVRKVFESIDWSNYVTNMGAPNVGGKSLVVQAYTETKARLGLDFSS